MEVWITRDKDEEFSDLVYLWVKEPTCYNGAFDGDGDDCASLFVDEFNLIFGYIPDKGSMRKASISLDV